MLLKSQSRPEIPHSANQAYSSNSNIQSSQLHQWMTGIAESHLPMSCKKNRQHNQPLTLG